MTARPTRFWSCSAKPSAQKHRLPKDGHDGWAIGGSVVHCIDIDSPLSLRARGSRNGAILAVSYRHHEAVSTLGQQLHRHRAVAFGDHQIERVRCSRTHEIAEILSDRADAGSPADLAADGRTDSARLSYSACKRSGGRKHPGALGDHHHRVIGGV